MRNGDIAQQQALINVKFGELFSPLRKRVGYQTVMQLMVDYPYKSVPDGVEVITCGVDVGDNYLMYCVRGWGAGLESWLIEWGFIQGSTSDNAVWDELAMLLERDFNGMPIEKMAIDSGHAPKSNDSESARTDFVYDFAARYPYFVCVCKGVNTMDKPFSFRPIDYTYKGKVHKNGIELHNINTDYFKSWLHHRLQWSSERQGAWHIPLEFEGQEIEYCKQIASEVRTIKPNGKPFWEKTYANHAFDCEVLNAFLVRKLKLAERLPFLDESPPKHVNPVSVEPLRSQGDDKPKPFHLNLNLGN